MNTLTIEQALQLAQQHWGGGRLAEAREICHQILAAFPEQPGALHLLAGMAVSVGQAEPALELLRRTVAAAPADVTACLHLGELLHRLHRYGEAEGYYQRAVALQPAMPEAHYWLGRLWRETGRLDEGSAHLERAIALDARWPPPYKELGKALLTRSRLEDARRVIGQGLGLTPEDYDLHNDYAAALTRLSRYEEARQHFARAFELNPGDAQAVNNLGFVLKKLGRMEEAKACCERALELRPGYASAYNNLGILHRNLLQPEQGIEYTRKAVAAEPESLRFSSDLVLAAYYHPGLSKEELRAELRGWNVRHALPLRQFWQPHTNDRNPERRLKVGYVSPDFCIHVVSHFTIPLLEAHDPAQVEVHCYASVLVPDVLTERLRRAAHRWHDVSALSNRELAERIRADGIDILVDLTVHTADNRLQVFAAKPAPVQVSWIGFAGSTGIEAIDYRLSDPVLDPPDADESWSAERPFRLPEGWCCYDPVHETPPVAPLPALRNGFITFGSLNNYVKLNAPTLRRWARALRAVPGSRLILHAPVGESLRAPVWQVLAEENIAPERVELVGHQQTIDYLHTYGRIDVGLDPFPFNGMTTTCDALWQGVPVLSLPGELPAARTGLSLLQTLGLEAWAARDEDEYAEKARTLTANLSKLSRLRLGMRRRMRESALMDGPRFARHVETAYRTMWREWVVSGQGVGHPQGERS